MVRARERDRDRSRSRTRRQEIPSRRETETRSPTCCATPRLGGPTGQIFLLISLPLTLIVFLGLAGVWTLSVFVFTTGGVSYHIGAQGYATTGQDRLSVCSSLDGHSEPLSLIQSGMDLRSITRALRLGLAPWTKCPCSFFSTSFWPWGSSRT